MAEVKAKGPLGIIIIILVIAGGIYYQFFMPVYLNSRERRKIHEAIKDVRMVELAKLTDATVKHYKATGKAANVLDKVKALSGKIEIKKIDSKRSLLGGVKLKVTYTMGGKVPKDDGGVCYFKMYSPKRKKSGRRRSINLYKITEREYNK
ncbi:MAG: hypothetical protein L3J71_17890 [Victivallaceae bacterium]|nr:hypothetical protein [Victivallaceae bacterium]